MDEVVPAVEQAFKDYATGRVQMRPKVYLQVDKGDFRAMPGAIPGAAGVKWVNVHPGNREAGLPTVMGILIYNDPDTAYPLAIMDATEITAYRTAATSAVASKYLARPDSRSLGLLGAGRQGRMHLESHAPLFTFDVVKVFDVRQDAIDRFVDQFRDVRVEVVSPEEVAASDILCTLTTATMPIVQAEWIKEGTHANAVGADAPGKQELDPRLLSIARVVVDDITQASHAGEINVPIRDGLFDETRVRGTLGEIITGARQGRENCKDITIFDSTGLAIEDLATAKLVYDKARQRGGYPTIDIV
jgi:alanine dehydrogenase